MASSARLVEVAEAAHVWGNWIDELLTSDLGTGGTRYFFLENAIGSVCDVTTTAGLVCEEYQYPDIYGKVRVFMCNDTGASRSCTEIPQTQIGNRHLFQGREWDSEIGKYQFRYRAVDSSTGRFNQRDPLSADPLRNEYTFVGNRPMVLLDPCGLIAGADDAAVVIVIGGVVVVLVIGTALASEALRGEGCVIAVSRACRKIGRCWDEFWNTDPPGGKTGPAESGGGKSGSGEPAGPGDTAGQPPGPKPPGGGGPRFDPWRETLKELADDAAKAVEKAKELVDKGTTPGTPQHAAAKEAARKAQEAFDKALERLAEWLKSHPD